jgi:quercetin dioxygenase-like cupin family protein
MTFVIIRTFLSLINSNGRNCDSDCELKQKPTTMKIFSFLNDLEPKPEKVLTKVILETSFSKEIRIQMETGQSMKEHQTPFPIIVHLLKGEIDFGVKGELHHLHAGDIVSLEGGVPHDLLAKEASIVRLSLSKLDRAERVQQVAQNS